MADMGTYPLVDCTTHGRRLLGYAVCVHVLAGAPICHDIAATPRRLGELLCRACHTPGDGEISLDALRLICERCVETLRPGGVL